MKRFVLLGGLLVANLIAFGVWSGWLDPWLPGNTEPQRLASQVAPDQVKVVPPVASKEAPPSAVAASANGKDAERGPTESATTTAATPSAGGAPTAAAPAAAAPAAQVPPAPGPAAPAPAGPAPATPAPAVAATPAGKASGLASTAAAPPVSPPLPSVAPGKAAPPAAAPSQAAPSQAAAPQAAAPQAAASQAAAPRAAATPTPTATAPAAPATPVPAPPVPAQPPVQVSAPAPAARDSAAASIVCVAAGPLDEARAERTRAWARKLAAGLQGKVERRAESTSYMVYVPASRTQADAQRRFDQLRQSGLTDIFLITEGSLRLAISLGIFRSQDGARAQIEALAARGGLDNLRIASIPGRTDRVWATLTRTANVADGPWDAARAQLKELAGVAPSACTP